MKNKIFAILVAAVCVVVACGKDDLASPDKYARLKVVHMAAGAPSVQVFLNDEALLQRNRVGTNDSTLRLLGFGVGFPAAGTSVDSTYVGVKSGASTLRLLTATNAVAYSGSIQLDAGVNYTAFAIDTPAVNILLLKDVFNPLVGGKAQLRIGHLAPRAGNVDLTVTVAGANAKRDTLKFPAVSYKTFTGFNDFATTDTITSIVARKAGDTLRYLNNTTRFIMANGRVYTIVARGAGNTFNSLSTTTINYSR